MTKVKSKTKKTCSNCGDDFEPSRTTAKFCSEACRKADMMVNSINEAIHRQHIREEMLLL